MLRQEIISPCCKAPVESVEVGVKCAACGRGFDRGRGYIDLLLTKEEPGLVQWLWENRNVVKVYGALRSLMMFLLAGSLLDEESEVFLIEHILQIRDDENILDLSCGNGRHALRVAERLNSGHLFCLDISEAMLNDLVRRLEGEGRTLANKITVIRGSSSAIPLRDGSLDKIYCVAAMHLFRDQQKVILEAGRVLKPGGVFLGTIFMKSRSALLRFLKEATYPLTGLVFSERESFSAALAQAGFEKPDFALLSPIASLFFTKKL